MLERLIISITKVQASNTSENLLYNFDKLSIDCIEQSKSQNTCKIM